jgi:uncharacterized damage-inducible protein DinB
MAEDIASAFLTDSHARFEQYRQLAERALAQVDDEAFFARLRDEVDPIAVIVKHIAGNLRSRWTEFLTTDGDKPDRDRDTEFELSEADTREALMTRWEESWEICLGTIGALEEVDVLASITIRGETLTVLEALHRSLAHTAYHVGQIVLLAKHHAGREWQSLSIPRGQSEQYNARKGYERPRH